MNTTDKKEIIITCGCTDLSHLMRITKYEDEEQAYVTMVMNHYQPIWKRIKLALAYVFKRPPCAGYYDEVVIEKKDVERLSEFLKGLHNVDKKK